jgi:hypothetical protein
VRLPEFSFRAYPERHAQLDDAQRTTCDAWGSGAASKRARIPSRGTNVALHVCMRIASRCSIPMFALMPVLVLAVPAAEADELAASASANTFILHDASSTLRDYCAVDNEGRTWLTLPGGHRYELITSTTDPAVANPGDGMFHPFDASQVQAALAEVRYPVGALAAEVFILPFPRRVQMESAAGPGLILLSPGVRTLSRAHQHAEFVHELGHVIQYALMPDGDSRWNAYRRMRAIDDLAHYSGSSRHADRPHEIFAEDFRALFGGADANYSGTIENDSLAVPSQVAGLEPFMLDLAGGAVAFRAVPNPTHGSLRLSIPRGTAVALDVFDTAGRRLATLAPRTTATGVEWMFDGRDASGRPVEPGVLFARPRGSISRGTRIVVVP